MNTRKFEIIARTFGGVALLTLALFCGFGFVRSFELLSSLAVLWPLGYAEIGCACLTGAVLLSLRPSSRFLAATALGAAAVFSLFGFVESSISSRVAGQAAFATLVAAFMTSCGYFIGFELSRFGR